MTVETFDEMDVRRELTRACAECGDHYAFARLHGLNAAYVLAVRRGEANLSWRLLQALGFMPVRRYVRDDSHQITESRGEKHVVRSR